MANWFLALPVEPGLWFGRVGAPPPQVRLFHPDDLHLTIAFLGACAEDAARKAFDALVWPLGPTEVRLGAVVALGDPKRPSALSAELDRGGDQVAAAMGSARRAAFVAAGAAPERRPPLPHVTIARPHKRASDPQRQEAIRWGTGTDLGGPIVLLDRLALYAWAADRSQRQFRIVLERPAGRSPLNS